MDSCFTNERMTAVSGKNGAICSITRDMRVFSAKLGCSGACDVVEFRRSESGIALHGQEGLYQPFPVEYKRGKKRGDTANALQLCGQAMCLEEMLCCDIPQGALYHGGTREEKW